jgi:amino acid transporter
MLQFKLRSISYFRNYFMKSEHIKQDQADLGSFGYGQQLLRAMGGFSNFAISFSIISILTGAVTLYGYGLEMGGPFEMSVGWPLATLGTLTVAASMAELCSAFPTAGGTYHWAAALGGPMAGWFVSIFSIVGMIAAQVGINYSCAQFLLPFVGVEASTTNLAIAFALILLLQGAINHWGVRLVAILNDFSVTVHIAGVLILVGVLFWFAPKQPVSFLFEATNSNGHHPYWWAFLLGLLQAQWTYTGFDGSASLSEETADPRRQAPWGIVLSVAVSGVAGYLLLMAITIAIHTIPEALHTVDAHGNAVPAVIAIMQKALGAKAGNAMAALASLAMWFCGLSGITSASRSLFALARDGGLPWKKLAQVDRVHQTPAAAIWTIVGISLAAIAASNRIPLITSVSTVALYVSYGVPVLLGLRARPHWTGKALWSLGRYGRALNIVAVVFAGMICIVLVMPPNQPAGYLLAGIFAVAIAAYQRMKRTYRGPAWALTPGLSEPSPHNQ